MRMRSMFFSKKNFKIFSVVYKVYKNENLKIGQINELTEMSTTLKY